MKNSFNVPAEWAHHKAIWTAWPSAADLWLENLEPARSEVTAMVRALADGDRVMMLASGEEAVHSARLALGLHAEVFPSEFGDIWVRDTGPVFSRRDGDSQLHAEVFQFNGWGGKYVLPNDDQVGSTIATLSGVAMRRHDFILEGGAVEYDGAGTVITTRQCLLNPNRNKGWTEAKAEAALAEAYGATKVIWLDEGLLNDHTDGHVDNLVRFIAPGRVVCQAPNGPDDGNASILYQIQRTLSGATDANGNKLEVISIPSPGHILNDEGKVMAASHMNFVIGNKTVVVPTYNAAGTDAVEALTSLFPNREVVGLSSLAILSGGGSFHCITQQEPQ